MANTTMGLSREVARYVLDHGTREPLVLQRLRDETSRLRGHQMQVAPEQGTFLAFLVELMGAKKCIEVGTFTGYSSTAVALALPEDGSLLCCDVSEEWTKVAQRYWAEAGVSDKVTLRIAPAVETLDSLIEAGEESAYDFAFLDADKVSYDDYYERLLVLVRPGGLIAIDNTLWGGAVLDEAPESEDTRALQALNDKLYDDERISLCLLPVADGITLALKR